MITSEGDSTICIGKGINRIRGTPGGRQLRIGSCESDVARGPYPGLAARNMALAQGCRGGSLLAKVIASSRSIQTPVKSGAEFVDDAPFVGRAFVADARARGKAVQSNSATN